MPVIMWLVVDQKGLFAGRIDDVGKWQSGEWRPAGKMRVCLERHLIIVKKCDLRIAGINDRMACARLLKRVIVARGNDFNVLSEECAKGGI